MPDALVVGAGALGGWTALHLARAGVDVELIDAWTPGHSRASSGGETRIIRRSYAARAHYVPLVTRAFEHWRALESGTGRTLLDLRGVLWLACGDDAFESASMRALEANGVPHERLDRAQVTERYPALFTDDMQWALFEPEAGALFARRGCCAVAEAVVAAGGSVAVGEASALDLHDGRCHGVRLANGDVRSADLVVLACGPWMSRLLPDLFALRVTRQEVMAFGTPAGDLEHGSLPVWADYASPALGDASFWYGIPGGLGGGFKLGEDTHGPEFDPSTGSRELDAARLARVRRYLGYRFPGLAGAPLIESRVCQYSMTADADLVVDRHPQAENTWLVGGGSGHAYKLGPAIGELVAAAALGDDTARGALARFRLDRQSSDGSSPPSAMQ